MIALLKCLRIVRGPGESGVQFFLGTRDFCTFHVRRKGSKETRLLQVRILAAREDGADRLEVHCRHIGTTHWTQLMVNINKKTGQGYIPWVTDAHGAVDPWPHLTPLPTAHP